MKLYGNVNNRLLENKQFCDKIVVGTKATVFYWSDRHPYEVTAVQDEKHLTIREMGHKKREGSIPMDNDWEVISDESKPEINIVKRNNKWYSVVSITPDEARRILETGSIEEKVWACNNNIDLQKAAESKRRIFRYHQMNISFGVASYYYDYSF